MIPHRSAAAVLDAAWPPVLDRTSRLLIQPLLGTEHVTIARWLPTFWALPDAERRRWRHERLAEVLGHVSATVPFYRGRPTSPDSLGAYPLVDKDAIRSDTPAFLSSDFAQIRTITKRTGGSTGDPWTYPLDRHAFSHMYAAQLEALGRHGYRYGQRRLYLGAPDSLGLHDVSPAKRVRMFLERNDASLTGLEIDRPHSIVRAVRAADRGARLWYGYASTVAALGQAVLEHDLPLEGPPLIVTMAERLYDGWRQAIERAFGTSLVVEEYGCNDGGVLAHSCPARRLHVAESLSIVEVLDGDRPCSPGEEGEVTVTNLHARALPFIRYQVGDRAVLGPERCSCGRPGLVLEHVTGRTGDQVRLPDGTALGVSAFTQPFKYTRDVRRWQVLQRSPDHLELRLDVTQTFDDEQRSLLRDYVRRVTGDQAEVAITTTEPLVRTSGGKHRVIVAAGTAGSTTNHHSEAGTR